MRNAFLIMGTVLPVVSSWTYIAGIIRGTVKPQRMTHFLLCAITGLSFLALVAGDDRSGVWLAMTSFVQCAAIAALSVRSGMGGRSRLDAVCLGLCLAGAGLWLFSGNSLFGLAMSIVADLVACVPSLVKTYRHPHTESFWFYALDTLAGLCIAAAGPYAWQAMLFPVYIAGINGMFVWFVLRPKFVRRYTPADRLNGTA